MKSILYTAAGALLILSSCSTAYQTARTPDDVYYSPRTERTAYASSNNNNQGQNQRTVAAANEDDGTYVTYDDEDQGDYAKRIDRFRNNSGGSYYDDGSPNVYVNNYYGGYGGGFGYSPYSYWGGGFGGYPYYGYGSGLSISLGLGWGWGGGYYSPWYSPYSFYSPYYSPWGYPHYYGGGWAYGGGYYGHYYPGGGYYAAPSRGYRSRSGFGGASGYTNGNPRTIPSGTTGNTGDYRPRRIFRDNSSGGFNGGSNSGGTYTPRRVFRSSPSETPTVRPGGGNNNNNGGSYAPRRVFQSEPREMRSNPAPQRTFSAPSYSPPPSNSGGSSGGGGGRSFRSRN